MKKLVGTGRSGDFVHRNQGMAGAAGFRNVSAKWLDKTITYEQGLAKLAEGQTQIEDLLIPVGDVKPIVDKQERFALAFPDGREFHPTPYCMGQLGNWASCGKWLVTTLMENPTNHRGEATFVRDRTDSETIAHILTNGLRRLDSQKQLLWRVRSDGTLRAVLSDSYATINNEWLVNALQRILPDGRLSHWKGDTDTIFGNVLIPDTLRTESDSDYGGMLSVGNSEIGERPIHSCPSVFRAICMNGCIWDQVSGQAFRRVHRGTINLEELFQKIKQNLEIQIPLLPIGIDKLLGTRRMVWGNSTLLPLFAQVGLDHKLSKKQASSLLECYNEERAVAPETSRTLFGVVNTITRAGQLLDNNGWVKFDTIGGTLVGYSQDDWNRLVRRANNLTVEEAEAIFATAA